MPHFQSWVALLLSDLAAVGSMEKGHAWPGERLTEAGLPFSTNLPHEGEPLHFAPTDFPFARLPNDGQPSAILDVMCDLILTPISHRSAINLQWLMLE